MTSPALAVPPASKSSPPAQRVEAAARMAILIALAAFECSPAQAPSTITVSLRVRGAPAGATVVIDDEPVGSLDFVAAHGVALPPGKHSVTVTARGYLPMDREVDAKAGAQPILLFIALTPVPD